MSSALVWFTFAALFTASSHCFVVNFEPKAADRVRLWKQHMPLTRHADETNDVLKMRTETIDRQPDEDTSSATQCGYQACFLAADCYTGNC